MLAADAEASKRAVSQMCLSLTRSVYFPEEPEQVPLPFVGASLSLDDFIIRAEERLFKERGLPAASPGRSGLADALLPEVTCLLF